MARRRLSDLRDGGLRTRPTSAPRSTTRASSPGSVSVLGAAIVTAFLTGLLSHLHQHPLAWLPLPAGAGLGVPAEPGPARRGGSGGDPAAAGQAVRRLPGAVPAAAAARARCTPSSARRSRSSSRRRSSSWSPGCSTSSSGTRGRSRSSGCTSRSPGCSSGRSSCTSRSSCRRSPTRCGTPWRSRTTTPTGRPGAGFLAGVAVTVLGLTALTVGQTVRPAVGRGAPLAPAGRASASQGLPVNRTAKAARGAGAARPTRRGGCRSSDRAGPLRLSRADLEAMPQVTVVLPIACVEGWSTTATWQGVRVGDLVRLVSERADVDVRFVSLQEAGSYKESVLPAAYARHPDTVRRAAARRRAARPRPRVSRRG